MVAAVNMYRQFGALAVVFAVLMVICLTERADRARILLAGILACGSLAANFIHIVAAAYPARGAVAAVILLLTADAILLQLTLSNIRFRVLGISLMVVMMLVSVPALLSGTRTIAVTYLRMHSNERYIYQCREQGILDVEIAQFHTDTKYSAADDTKYIDTEDPTSWPNDSMAKYYEVNSIIGK